MQTVWRPEWKYLIGEPMPLAPGTKLYGLEETSHGNAVPRRLEIRLPPYWASVLP
jgi:hypothetical protein